MAAANEIEALEDIVVDIHRSSHDAIKASASRNVKKFYIKKYEEKLATLLLDYGKVEENLKEVKTQASNYQELITSLEKTIKAMNFNNIELKNIVLEKQANTSELKKNSERIVTQFQEKWKTTHNMYEKSPLAVQRTALNRELNIFEFELVLAKKSYSDFVISVQMYKEIKSKLCNILIVNFVKHCKKTETAYKSLCNLSRKINSKEELYDKLFNEKNSLLQMVQKYKTSELIIETRKDKTIEISGAKQPAGLLPILNFGHSSIPTLYLPRRDFLSQNKGNVEALTDRNESQFEFSKLPVKTDIFKCHFDSCEANDENRAVEFKHIPEIKVVDDENVIKRSDKVKESDNSIESIDLGVYVKKPNDFHEEENFMVEQKTEKIEIIADVKVKSEDTMKLMENIKQTLLVMKENPQTMHKKEFGEAQKRPCEDVDKNDIKKVTFDTQLTMIKFNDETEKQSVTAVKDIEMINVAGEYAASANIKLTKESDLSTFTKNSSKEIGKPEGISQYFNQFIKVDPIILSVTNSEGGKNEIDIVANMDLIQIENKANQITEIEDFKGKEINIPNNNLKSILKNKPQEISTPKYDISNLLDFGSPISSDCGDINYSNYSSLLNSLALPDSPVNLNESIQSTSELPSQEPPVSKSINMFGFGFETFTANRFKFFTDCNKGSENAQKEENNQNKVFKGGHKFGF